MSKKILIANRGEIAIRIIRSAKKLGLTTYVIQGNREPDAMYLEYADEIIPIRENLSEKIIFLNPEEIIRLALEYKIDMIHPGYGFLSENPDFAALCEQNDITFIGPSSDLIRNMGIKTIAKKMAAQADGVIVGSAIVKLCETHGADCVPYIKEYVKSMKDAIR